MYDSVIPGIPLAQCIALLRTQMYSGQAPSNLNLNYVEKRAFPQEYWTVAIYYYNNASLTSFSDDALATLVLSNMGFTATTLDEASYTALFTNVRNMYVNATNSGASRDSIIEDIVTYVGNQPHSSIVGIYTRFVNKINANYEYGKKLDSTNNVNSGTLTTIPTITDAIRLISTDINIVGVQKAIENETYLIYKKIKEFGAFQEIISADREITAAITAMGSYTPESLLAIATQQATDLGVPPPTAAQMRAAAAVIEEATKQATDTIAYAKLISGADTTDKKIDAIMLTLLQAQKINKELDFSSVTNGLKLYTEANQVKSNIINTARSIQLYVQNIPNMVRTNSLSLIASYGNSVKSVLLNDKNAFERAKNDIRLYSIALHLPDLLQNSSVGSMFGGMINSNVLGSVNSYIRTANKIKLLQKGITNLR